jgi:predicted glutamine amidotransferase
MCQLLGMNCNTPTDICFSFTGFKARGGLTDVHQDGWGIAFFEGKGVRLFLDPLPSAHSPIAELVRNYPIKSQNVIAHIRKATQGEVSLENTHPFMRELWGEYWIFAHNGNLLEVELPLSTAFYPVGKTDSEKIFCWILQKMKDSFGDKKPPSKEIFKLIQKLSCEIGKKGEFNFLLSNGDVLFAHSSTNLSYIIRQAPFLTAKLKDEDIAVDFNSVTTANDRVAVIATTPLTQNENWTLVEPGNLLMFSNGEMIFQEGTVAGPKEKVLCRT